MTDRLLKRHKRQVLRAKEKVRLSEPDVRTEEEIRAARDASRAPAARRNDSVPHYAAPSRSGPAPARGSSVKTDV